ncbi:MAG: alcohol dehydrogenase catalytic domain-containing protein [Deltaproteobacteria bacterium]|nr:MAG: alcohol dehydrogenase catalytic domain-containing protein [Deltaproteobacteria bacterium]
MIVSAVQNDHSLKLEERDKPILNPGEALLQVAACGLCGTDILKIQKKSSKTGTVLGHEVSGVIVESKNEKFALGGRVVVAHHVPCFECHFCLHENFSMCAQFKKTNLDPGGFAQFLKIPQEHCHHTAFKIPDHLSFAEASFMEPIACCLRAVKRSRLKKNDSCLVIGLGSIGLLLVQLLKHFGVNTYVMDLVEERIALAEKFGGQKFNPDKLQNSSKAVDMLLFTAGNNALLTQSLAWVRDGGKIHLFSSIADGEKATLDLNQIYHRELELFSTYSSAPQELKESLDLLANGSIDVKPLITHTLPLSEIPQAIEGTLQRKILKAIIVP